MLGDTPRAILVSVLAVLAGIAGTAFAAGLIARWFRDASVPWRVLIGLLAVAIGFSALSTWVGRFAGDSQGGKPAGSNGTATATAQATAALEATTPGPRAAAWRFVAQCEDVLPADGCERRDPLGRDVVLKVAAVASDEEANLAVSVTIANRDVQPASSSAYDISAWYIIDSAARIYHADVVRSTEGLRSFLLREDESVSGFVAFQRSNEVAAEFSLYAPPFGGIGPFGIAGMTPRPEESTPVP